MSEAKHYLEGVAPRGSAFYYSIAHLKPRMKRAVLSIQGFYEQLINSVYQATDANIAKIKMQWWKDELGLLSREFQSAEVFPHPLLSSLQEVIQQFNVNKEDLISLVDGVQEKLFIQPFMNFEELTIHIMRTQGLKEKIIADIVAPGSNIEVIYQFAMVQELIEYLQYMRRDLQRGMVFIPVDELDKFSVTLSMLEQGKSTPEIIKLFEFQGNRILNLYNGVLARITRVERGQLRSLRIRAGISVMVLQEIINDHYRVLEHFIKLTPLRMWWISLTV